MDKYVVINRGPAISIGIREGDGEIMEVISVALPRSVDLGFEGGTGQNVSWAKAFARFVVMALNAAEPFEFTPPDAIERTMDESAANAALAQARAGMLSPRYGR